MKKKYLMLAVLLFIAGFIIWSNALEDYGSNLPPMLSTEIPIIDGEIISSKEAKFDDGRGYVIEIKTEKSFEEVIAYYKDGFNKNGVILSFHDVSSEERFASAEAVQQSTIILLEIIDKVDYTFVTMAIHLGK